MLIWGAELRLVIGYKWQKLMQEAEIQLHILPHAPSAEIKIVSFEQVE